MPRQVPDRPASTGRGESIAFSACDDRGISQIVLAEPDGRSQRAITDGPTSSWFPAWSPDGTRILFARESAGGGGIPQLWIMNSDGSEARALVSEGVSLAGGWSPDGQQIAYSHGRSGQGLKIWIARGDGSQARRLTNETHPAVDENVPRWSPDGARVTYTSNLNGRYEIWVADVVSGHATSLTRAYFDPQLNADIEQKVPAWSPDGLKIAYWSGVEGTDPRPNLPRDVWVMNADGTGQKRLVAGDDPNWSPSGEFIIHSAHENGQAALRIARPDGNDARILFTVDACRPLQSSWLGKPQDALWGSVACASQIVFMAPTGSQGVPGSGVDPGAWELVVMNLDGTGRRQVTHNQEQEFLPHFSPDGTRLLYTRFTSGGYGIGASQSRVTVYDFATDSTRDLTDAGKDSYPVWSPDGSRIAFLSTRGDPPGQERHALWVMDVDGSEAHEVGRPSGSSLDFEWGDIAWSSQDWILFVVAENDANNTCFKTRLDKIRPDGTERTQVTDGGPNCTPAGMEQSGDADPGFSADGATIYTSRGFPASPPGIPGGTVRRLYAASSDAWNRGKPEYDLSLANAPDCIEGVPKGSPDATRTLLFRFCAGERAGVTLTDTEGSYRTWIADGFGPDWNPAWKP
jgi:Tol biopolymer transport system component